MKKYYHKGEQVKTIGAPYMFNGGEFIDAHDANGENITLPTHAQRAANAERAKSEWRAQQRQFAKLHAATETRDMLGEAVNILRELKAARK